MKAWLKGIVYAVVIWVALMLLWGVSFSLKQGGRCSFFDDVSVTFFNCFAAPIILTIYAIIPVVVVGFIIGLIIWRFRKK